MTESTPSTDFTIEYPSAGWSLRHPVDAALQIEHEPDVGGRVQIKLLDHQVPGAGGG